MMDAMKDQGIKEEESIMAMEDEKNKTKQVEEIKMLSDTITEALLGLDKYTLHELMTILQKNSKYHSINVHQAGFGSYIHSHVLKEKIGMYNRESWKHLSLGIDGPERYK
jgi:hypothetical protein